MKHLKRYIIISGFISLLFGSTIRNYAQGNQAVLFAHDQVKNLLQSDPDSAIAISNNLLPLVSEIESDSLLAKTQYYLAVAYYYKGYYRMSNNYFQKAIDNDFSGQNPEFLSICKNNMGVNYDMLEKYPASIDSYLKAMNIAFRLGDSLGGNLTKVNIGLLYGNIGQRNTAMDLLNEALDYFTSTENVHGKALANQNLGKVLMDQKRHNEAWPYLLRARDLYIQSGEKYELGMVYISLSTTANELHRHTDSERFIDSALLIGKNGNYQYLTTRAQMGKAKLYLHQSKYEKAKTIADAIESKNLRSELNRLIILVEAAAAQHEQQDFKAAFNELLTLQDSLVKIKSNDLINELHIEYETEKNKKMLATQKKLIGIYKRQNLIYGISSLAILLLMGIILIYNQKLKKSYNTLFDKNIELSKNYQLGLVKIPDHLPHQKEKSSSTNPERSDLWSSVLHVLKNDKAYKKSDFSLDDLVKICNSNKTYITNEIKQNTGSNFRTLVNKFRVEEAMLTMKDNPNYSNDAVASSAGFNSISSFHRIFKNYTGLSPQQYQKRLKKK